jgi:uncharacterized protein (UPF0333 family)
MSKIVIAIVLVAVVVCAGYVVVHSMDSNGQVSTPKAQAIIQSNVNTVATKADTAIASATSGLTDHTGDVFTLWCNEFKAFVDGAQAVTK